MSKGDGKPGGVLVELKLRKQYGPPKRSYGKFTIKEGGLYLGSAPTPCEPLEIDQVAEQRNVLCRRYGNCVTYAAANNWKGFHCQSCGMYEEMSPQEQRKDLEGLADFLAALDVGRR